MTTTESPLGAVSAILERIDRLSPGDPEFGTTVRKARRPLRSAIRTMQAEHLAPEMVAEAAGTLGKIETYLTLAETPTFAVDEQLRVPKGNGRRSGRWVDMPWTSMDNLRDFLDTFERDGGVLPDNAAEALDEAFDTIDELRKVSAPDGVHRADDFDKAFDNDLGKAADLLDEASDEMRRGDLDPALSNAVDNTAQNLRDFSDLDLSLLNEPEDVNPFVTEDDIGARDRESLEEGVREAQENLQRAIDDATGDNPDVNPDDIAHDMAQSVAMMIDDDEVRREFLRREGVESPVQAPESGSSNVIPATERLEWQQRLNDDESRLAEPYRRGQEGGDSALMDAAQNAEASRQELDGALVGGRRDEVGEALDSYIGDLVEVLDAMSDAEIEDEIYDDFDLRMRDWQDYLNDLQREADREMEEGAEGGYIPPVYPEAPNLPVSPPRPLTDEVDYGRIGEAVNNVWQSLTDEELLALTPERFYEMIAALGLSDEEAEEAWEMFEERQEQLREGGFSVTAAAAPVDPDAPPVAHFNNPQLREPTALTVTDDGRVYGHLATWNACHLSHSKPGKCVTAPKSRTGYAYFRTGAVRTAEGAEIPVGQITLDTGHAADDLRPAATLAHYDNTGKAVADVAVGEDKHGIWFSGSLRPGVTPERVRALRASPLSGDWRRIGGNLELVAALAVNVPGLPVPRPSGMVASGAMTSLVAAGMLPPKKVRRPGTPNALSMDDLRYLKRLAARERAEEAEQKTATLSAANALAIRLRAQTLASKISTTNTPGGQ